VTAFGQHCSRYTSRAHFIKIYSK